jgi:hypothetical protein
MNCLAPTDPLSLLRMKNTDRNITHLISISERTLWRHTKKPSLKVHLKLCDYIAEEMKYVSANHPEHGAFVVVVRQYLSQWRSAEYIKDML